jgi:hypothetical protein
LAVRDKVTSAITEYCQENPDVDYVHFWLADIYNNHCECELCKDTEPADFYVMILNQLDEKMNALGLKTRIVFLLYQELLWAPKQERIKNPGRFVLLFAPISRTYSTAYTDVPIDVPVTLESFERNRIHLPRDVAVNVARLREWQKVTPNCDSLIFDYHLLWDHFKDPGCTDSAKVLFKDMKNLDKLGLNGMLSCQTQRSFFPTGLGMFMMALALWNKNSDYDTAMEQYFRAAYGTAGKQVLEYLASLSKLFDPPYIRHEKPQVDPAKAKDYAAIETLLDTFAGVINENIDEGKNADPGIRYSWKLLAIHRDLCRILARSFGKKAAGNQSEAEALFNQAVDFLRSREMEVHDALDVFLFINTMKHALCGMETAFMYC